MENLEEGKLTDRQKFVISHILDTTDYDLESAEYFPNDEEDENLIEVMLFEPTKNFNFFLLTTVGLSEYKPDENFARCELIMLLPPSWKKVFNMTEYSWPIKFLKRISTELVENERGVFINNVYTLEGEVFHDKYIGGVVTFAENLPIKFLEEIYEGEYTRFFQICPIDKVDLNKIEEIGISKFIEFELHDAEGPKLIVEEPTIKTKPVKRKKSSLDKIISYTEKGLNEGKKE